MIQVSLSDAVANNLSLSTVTGASPAAVFERLRGPAGAKSRLERLSEDEELKGIRNRLDFDDELIKQNAIKHVDAVHKLSRLRSTARNTVDLKATALSHDELLAQYPVFGEVAVWENRVNGLEGYHQMLVVRRAGLKGQEARRLSELRRALGPVVEKTSSLSVSFGH